MEARVETVRVVCAHDCPDMCSLLAHVEGGRVLRIEGDPEQPFTAGFACAKVMREPELVHSPERLLAPLRRTGEKGEGRFAPVSWVEALDEITLRWRQIIAESGPTAILGYAYSAHQGQMNRGLVNGFFHALGASRLIAGTVCDTCCETAWDMTVGPVGGVDPEAVEESDLVVSWGADLVATNVHFWAKLEKVRRRRRVPLVVIDPRKSRTAERADWHLPIRIGTDAALALGVMHILVRDGLCDREYLAAHTLGFERLETQVLPRFPPSRAAEITGLAEAEIERLAALYGKAKRSFIRLGEGMTRLARGGEALRAVALLPGLTGAYGRRGGGALLLTAASCELDYDFVRKPSGPQKARLVNHLRLGEALLTMADPPIRALFVASNNPAVTCPEAGKVRRGLQREDLFTVVHDPFLSVTARYADIVLPAATYLETEDLYRAYGTYYMQYAPAAVPPQGESWSNLRLAQELARHMGLEDPVFRMGQDEILRRMLQGARGRAAVDPERLREAGPIRIAPEGGQEFRTPSGKLEFYSERLAQAGLAPMPDWHPDPQEEREAARWPLRLLTAPGYFQSHTAYSGNAFLRRREGPPSCILNPADAASRGLADGDKVRLFNDRGMVGLVLKISEEVPPGIVLVPGQRPDNEALSGTVNLLCSDRYTDMGEGATYQSTWLDVAEW